MESKLIYPGKNDENRDDILTVGKLKEFLMNVPDNYIITYDGFCSDMTLGNFVIDTVCNEVSLNG